MKKLAFALALAVAVFGGAVAITTISTMQVALACENC
jgi:hypothetical protein